MVFRKTSKKCWLRIFSVRLILDTYLPYRELPLPSSHYQGKPRVQNWVSRGGCRLRKTKKLFSANNEYCIIKMNFSVNCYTRCEELITFNNQQITFWSNSLSALQALSNKIHNDKSINDCHKAITKLADENTVHLKWIKAHTGHWGNEKADELTKAGTVSSNLVCSLVPLNHIKNMINDKVNSLTHKRWNTNRHAHTDLILGNHHTKTYKQPQQSHKVSHRYMHHYRAHRPQQTPSQN